MGCSPSSFTVARRISSQARRYFLTQTIYPAAQPSDASQFQLGLEQASHEYEILMWSAHNMKHIQGERVIRYISIDHRYKILTRSIHNTEHTQNKHVIWHISISIWVEMSWSWSHRHQWIRQTCWEENELSKEKKSAHAAQHIILEQTAVMTQNEESCSFFSLCQEQETENLREKLSALSQCSYIMLNCRLLTWQHTQTLSSHTTVNYNLLIFSKIRFSLII